jgi:hypothetical protein
MRRMWTMLVSMAMCLALGGVPTTAQDQPVVATGPGNAWVTVVKETCGWRQAGTSGTAEGFGWVRGFPIRCTKTFSDPRVSGEYQILRGQDCFGKDEIPCVIWETVAANGPDGTWTGWTNGTVDAGVVQRWITVLTGAGAYEGLTFVLHGVSPSADGKTDQVGYIYQGNPPPTASVASTAVEASPSPGA